VSPPNRDKLTMRIDSLKTLDLILSLSKDEAKLSGFFSSLPMIRSSRGGEAQVGGFSTAPPSLSSSLITTLAYRIHCISRGETFLTPAHQQIAFKIKGPTLSAAAAIKAAVR
jgi:hypothetical protein